MQLKRDVASEFYKEAATSQTKEHTANDRTERKPVLKLLTR
jgi:hypothetical protein